MTAYIKARKKGDKQWSFLTSKGGINKLRVHAAIFDDEAAQRIIDANNGGNQAWEFKVQKVKAGEQE